ncbi:transcriptional regulator [Natrarchaeobaculum aegyptiacum]|uniref:(S)-8-amino-7-oxononanoate synthase BioU n=1 Tax=Natrarchaeobaculum aegyptiacum TaxID=745377 RepID=A0A2Z2HU67_9EURY|nr:transcriptional regulator [Natrarchaeobaculum aegyptiacum]ARS90781.1 transcriptional regulator [Natrarchaeobaculum aegyptiacum]
MDDITFAVLGTGGIGRRALEVSQHKDALTPVAACDRHGVAIDSAGLDVDELLEATEGNIDSGPQGEDVATDGGAVAEGDGATASGGVKQHGEGEGVVASAQAHPSEDPIQEIIDHGEAIDAVLLALPNYEHDFIPRTADRFVEGGYSGVLIDVLKRSRVIGMLDERSETLEQAGITFVCGAGATPGLLTGAAALAAQSFVEITDVDIWWGVGLESGYEDNRGTVREDIAHLPEYDLETARSLSEDDIEAIVDDHDGVLEFEDMEHADDVLLERAGVCDAADVTVGGVLDVRNDEKPTTTTVRVTGRTFDGETATNTFQLGDATSMAANVNGPALGYLKAGVRRNRAGEYGVVGPAELMPGF